MHIGVVCIYQEQQSCQNLKILLNIQFVGYKDDEIYIAHAV